LNGQPGAEPRSNHKDRAARPVRSGAGLFDGRSPPGPWRLPAWLRGAEWSAEYSGPYASLYAYLTGWKPVPRGRAAGGEFISHAVSVVSHAVSFISHAVSVVSRAVSFISDAVSVVSHAVSFISHAVSVVSDAVYFISDGVSVVSDGVSFISHGIYFIYNCSGFGLERVDCLQSLLFADV